MPRVSEVRLADIRCETCEQWQRYTVFAPDHGFCKLLGVNWHERFACIYHPLWQRALAEEQKGGSDAKSE